MPKKENDNSYFSKKNKYDANSPSPFAEIIESKLEFYKAECWKWDQMPNFGSLVISTQATHIIIGCVTEIETSSSDPTHKPFPFQKTEEELKQDQPQIFALLRTTITVFTLGYFDKTINKIYYRFPLLPCKIHSFVSLAPPVLVKSFFKNFIFLNQLFQQQNQISNFEQLLLALLLEAKNNNLLTPSNLHQFCEIFSLYLGNNYKKLKLFLSLLQINAFQNP